MDFLLDADMTCVMHDGGAFCIAEMIPPPARWTPEEREAAIVAAMPAIAREAIRIANGVGGATDADELISVAYLKTVELSLRFDPSGPATFTTFVIGYLRRRLLGVKVEAQRLDGRTADRDPDSHAAGGDDAGQSREPWEAYWDAAFPMPVAPELPPDVAAAVESLPEFSRTVARLTAEGLSPQRIAVRMGASVTAIRQSQRNVIRALATAGVIAEQRHDDYRASLPPRPPKRERPKSPRAPKRDRPKPPPRIRAVTTPTRSQQIRAARQALAESRRLARVELGRRLLELSGMGMTVAQAADAVGVSFCAARSLRKTALRRLAEKAAAGG